MIPYVPGMALDVWGARLNGAARRCDHLAALVPVVPLSGTCGECEAAGAHWAALVVCLTCGRVACSDASPERHALAHYEETDHPVVGALRPESTWRWCYVHQRAI